jgi:hypothetical protein
MTLYPSVYEKARRSIDQVVGTDRLVDISDREALPYITCVLKEVLRCVIFVTRLKLSG